MSFVNLRVASLIGTLAESAGQAGTVTIVTVLASLTACLGAAGTFALQRRDAKRNVRKDYVDANFAVQQGVIENLRIDDTRLRALCEQRLKQIETLEDEIEELHADLARCRKKADDCLKRIAKLESEQSS